MNTITNNEQAVNFMKHYKRGFRDGKNSRIAMEGACRFYLQGYAEGDKYRQQVVAKMHADVEKFNAKRNAK